MLLDNRNSGYVGKELKERSFEDSKLAVLSSLFTWNSKRRPDWQDGNGLAYENEFSYPI